MKTERGVSKRVLLLSEEGVVRGWDGKGVLAVQTRLCGKRGSYS